MIVVWRVTELCNLACSFCAFDRRLDRPRRVSGREEVLAFGRVLGDYQRSTGERVMVSWIGGEPLLWPAVFEVSRQLQRDHGLSISATTNGTTLHRANVQRQIQETFSELTLSVDGPAAFHDSVRGAPGNWAQLQRATRALADARDELGVKGRPLRLRANTVLMHNNLPMFAALCHTLADWGVVEITFNQLGGRDRPEFFPSHRLRPEDAAQLAALVPPLRDALAQRGVKLCGSAAYLKRIEASVHNQRIEVTDCAPGERFLFLDESGRLAPCSFSLDEWSVPMAELSSADDLVALPQRFAALRQHQSALACSDCPSTQVFPKFIA